MPDPALTVARGVRRSWAVEQYPATSDRGQFWTLPVETRAELLKVSCPKTLTEATNCAHSLWLATVGNVSAIGPEENGIVDPRVWLHHFYGLFWQTLGFKEQKARGISGRKPPSELKGRWALPIVVACELRNRGFVLGQQDVMPHFARFMSAMRREENLVLMNYINQRFSKISEIMTDEIDERLRGGAASASMCKRLNARAVDLGLCTNLDDLKDITWEFADAFRTPSPSIYYARSALVTGWLRDKARANGGGKRAETREDPFLVQLERYRTTLPKWFELFEAYRKTIVVKKARDKARVYLDLLDWALEDPARHDPKLILRHHIRDDRNLGGTTFYKRLLKRDITAKSKNAFLNAAFAFFEFVAQENPQFRNPIFINLDAFARQIGERSSVGKTYRKRIPSYVLDDLKNFLVTPVEGGFRWGDWASQQDHIIINGVPVFCPIRAAILALLASWPLRINQVSWLDSGEMDDKIFNTKSCRFEDNGDGILGRKMGVIQPAADVGFDECHRLDLMVAINKRPLGEPAEYTIPYVDERTLWIVRQVREWQRTYGIPPQVVREADCPYDNGIAQDDSARELMPEICPLFRDPAHRGLFPPSYGRMKSYWSAACEAYDERNKQWTNPQTGEIEERHGWPRLSKAGEQIQTVYRQAKNRRIIAQQSIKRARYRYDLYSLKVGGVSHLLDRGVPLAIVAAIAGHKTLSMTLRYFVLDRTVWREKLSQLAKEDARLHMRPTEIEARLRDVSSHQDWLLGNSVDAFTALQHAVSEGMNFTVGTTGICPGTRCEEGLRLKRVKSDGENRSGVVPGSLCGLCDFRVYGPPFLLGLAKEFNETLYVLSELASTQQKLRANQRTLEAEGKFDEAIVCRNEDEELSRRAEPDCAHAARLYEMINESVQMLEKTSAATPRSQSMLIAQKPTVRPTVEAVGTFEQWKEILEMAEFLPATKSMVPEQVSARFQNKLMGVLAKNGAEPFLAVLPETLARKASLEFAAILERSVPSSATREAIFEGSILLSEIGKKVSDTVMADTKRLHQKYTSQEAMRLCGVTAKRRPLGNSTGEPEQLT